MSDTPQQPFPTQFRVNIPDDQRPGTYANFLSVWHSKHDFVLDFGVTDQPVGESLAGQGEIDAITIPVQVLSRVRIPVTVAEDVLQALAGAVTEYEENIGRIRQPGEDA